MELRRPHPLYAVVSLSRYLYLLLLPLARGFISAWGGGVAAWLEGAWFDLCILGLLFGLGGLLWLCTQYRADKEGIFLTTGIFRRREVLLPAGKMHLPLSGAAFLSASIPGGIPPGGHPSWKLQTGGLLPPPAPAGGRPDSRPGQRGGAPERQTV